MKERWVALALSAVIAAAISAAIAPATEAGNRASERKAPYRTVLVSREGLRGATANDQSYRRPAISADGRYIAFFTVATNLEGGEADQSRIYRKDTKTGELALVSREHGPDGRPIEGGDPAMSRNGNHICWVSHMGSGLGLAGAEGRAVVRDVAARATHVVPGSALGAEDENRDDRTTTECAISDDGHRVAYATKDSHSAADGDMDPDVYVHDLRSGTWTLVSRADGADGENLTGAARSPVMTPDGRYIAYWALGAPSVVAGPVTTPVPGGTASVFVRDTAIGRTALVSQGSGCGSTPSGNARPGQGSYDPSISDDGRYVAFSSSAGGLDVSAPPADARQVYVRDTAECKTHLVSRESGVSGEPSDGGSSDPSISPDGRFVVFESFGTNLDRDSRDDPEDIDIFIRDWRAGRTTLVSRASGVFGAAADDYSFAPALAAKNRRVAFVSRGENLSADDVAVGDVFYRDTVHRRRPLPADIPGRPRVEDVVARGAYRRGRAFGIPLEISFELSEFARVRLTVEPRRRVSSSRRDARSKRGTRLLEVVGEEGHNSVRLRRGLPPGRYRLSLVAIDFNHERARRALRLTLVPPGRR